jgi:hypothetical protein
MSILGTAFFLLIIGVVTAADQYQNEKKLSQPGLFSSLRNFIGDYDSTVANEKNVVHNKQLSKFTVQDTVTYSIAFVYSDNQCTSMTTAVAQRVNQCYLISGNYTKIIATASNTNVTTISTTYKDSKCTKPFGKIKTKVLSAKCSLVGSSYVKPALSSVFSFRSAAEGLQIR